MDQVLVIDGDWTLEVVDDPHGIVLRAPPERPKFLSPGERIRCDRRVKAAGETVTFYRVAGTEGWVLDVKGPHATSDTSNKRGWSIEFVSGLALAFDLEEMSCNQTSNILSSRTMDEKRINVYYTTRTVGMALAHPSRGKTQLFRCLEEDLKEIMQNPRVHTDKRYIKRPMDFGVQDHFCYWNDVVKVKNSGSDDKDDEFIDEEEDHRSRLIEYEKEEEKLIGKKMLSLRALKAIGKDRAHETKIMTDKINARALEFEQKNREEAEAEEEATRRKREAEFRPRCTCSVC
mmetsp:Transcript_17797/g.35688  ORF Transcript_17797/g.35688 Transcript_17797/m.35688 type:complete len:289 (-) Transcript_17797:214-1080(-)